ncbi:hypothetical protein MKL09_31405 [Methylobacterium sp. J-048]|uniref:hypothetical protein n=1 Tax=Methylobacterium sp. J-048 TaxID=2836635 RepID=UPI001FBA7192|nr:hypothetical protein [Methylobacterium sp. J-048]MCJ2061014.1 hypothetical protein [Methylobacterium sp. J-048]
MPNEVYFLEIIAKNDLEDTGNLKARVISQVKCWCKPGFHAKRLLKFVLVTPETLDQLFDRLAPMLESLKDSGSIERFVLHPAPSAVVTDHGKIDALAHYLRAGQVEAAERNKSQRLRHLEGRQRRV